MKIRHIITPLLILCAVLVGCSVRAAQPTETNDNKEMKSIIVYFTHSNNTGLAAQKLAEVTGADIVRLEPAEPYSTADLDWTNEQSRCTQEHLDRTRRPAIKPLNVNFNDYDTIFIGFPIWWHEEPALIRTFLDSVDLKGKQIYPFCTSYESPMSEADATLKKGYPNLNWHTGLRFPATPEQIKDWLK